MTRAAALGKIDQLVGWAERQPEMQEFYSASKPEWVREAARIVEGARNESGESTGLTHFDQVLRFRPGETTLWIGANGSGKTQALAQFTARWALQGKHCFVLSLEMAPARQVARLARLMLAKRHPTEPEIDAAMRAVDDSYTIANVTGRIEPRLALAILLYAAKEHRAQHIVIDNLTMMLSVDNDDGAQVQAFVGQAVRLTSQFGCHTHLVAHIRKPQDKGRVPDRYDARGTGSAADQVDNVIAVWRNEVKEDRRSSGDASLDDKPDAIFNIDKQRENGERGQCGADFFSGCGRFVDRLNTPEALIELERMAA